MLHFGQLTRKANLRGSVAQPLGDSLIIPTKEREDLRSHSRPTKLAVLFGCAVIVLFVAFLACVGESTTIRVRCQSRWEFAVRYFRGDGPDSFHGERSELRVGPLEFDYTYQVSAGPVVLIQTIAIGKQREIDIFAQHIDTKERESTVLLCSFSARQRHIQSGTYSFGMLDGATDGLQFDLISSQDGDLVGVTKRSEPDVVLILGDFSSGLDWPGFDWPGRPWTAPNYWEAKERTAESLIAQLAQDNHLGKLVLGSSSRSKGIAALQRVNGNQ